MNFNVESVLQEIDKVGEYLAQKLQVPVEKAYEILMRQVWFDFTWSMVWLVVGLVFCVVGIYLLVLTMKHCRAEEGWIYDMDVEVVIPLVSTFVTPLSLVLFFSNLYKVLQILINPEWYMIQMILQKVNGM